MAGSKSTLFLGDLSTFCNEEDVHNAFSPFGHILEIKIMRSEETNRNLSYGFIKFSNPADAKKAMNALDGSLFCGRHLRVGWASFRSKKEPRPPQHHDRIESASVHVSYISYQLRSLITEESLRILFSTYGVVLDCSIKKSYVDQAISRQCGYGFIHYASTPEGVESALAAVAGLNDRTLDDVCYKCSISHNLEKQLMESGRHFGGNSPMTPGTSSPALLKPTFASAGSSPMNGSPAPAHGFPRSGSNNTKSRGGVTLLNPTRENSAPSPMSWSPAPGFYNSHHQLYTSQQQVPTPSSTRPLIPPIHKHYHSLAMEEKRQQFAKQTSLNDDELFYSSMMEREFSGRIPIPTNASELNNATPLNSFGQNHSNSSAADSQRGSPTNSITGNNGTTQNFTSLVLPSSLNSQSSGLDGMSLLSLSQQQQQQQQPQQQPVFKFENNSVPSFQGFGSSVDPDPIAKNGVGNGNSAFVAASAILGSGFPSQQPETTDLSCSMSSSGRYSLFSDCSVGPLSSDRQQQSAPTFPSSLLPPLGVPLHGFYDNLLNLSTSTDRTDMDRDSIGHQSLQNLPEEKSDSLWCGPNSSSSGTYGLFDN